MIIQEIKRIIIIIIKTTSSWHDQPIENELLLVTFDLYCDKYKASNDDSISYSEQENAAEIILEIRYKLKGNIFYHTSITLLKYFQWQQGTVLGK